MATIGTLSVKLAGDTLDFTRKMLQVIFLTKSAGGALKTLAIAGVGATLSLATMASGAIASVANNAVDAIVATTRLSRELGATTEGIVALRVAARDLAVESSSVDRGLASLNSVLGAATTGSSELTDVFARLGVSAQQLANMPTDRAFAQVARAIANIPDPTRRAAIAVQLFGAEAARLLPLLSAGGDALDEAAARANATGQAFNQIDGTNVETAAMALDRVKGMLEGIVVQIVTNVAPAIVAVANEIQTWGNTGESVGERVIGVLKWIVKAYYWISDAIQVVRGTAQYMYASLVRGASAIVQAIISPLEAILALARQLPDAIRPAWIDRMADGISGLLNTVNQYAESVADGAAAILQNVSNSGDVDRMFARVADGARRAGMEMNRLRSAGGAVAAAVRNNPLFQSGLQVFTQNRTALEVYGDEMDRLNALLGAGAISWNTWGRAAERAVNALEQAHQLQSLQLPGAMSRNTSAAQSAITQAQNLEDTRLRESPQQRIQRILEQSLEVERQQREYTRRMAEALTGQQMEVVRF